MLPAALLLTLASGGCELVADFDREKIVTANTKPPSDIYMFPAERPVEPRDAGGEPKVDASAPIEDAGLDGGGAVDGGDAGMDGGAMDGGSDPDASLDAAAGDAGGDAGDAGSLGDAGASRDGGENEDAGA